jgi:biopolymer transport protein ExbD
MRAPLHKSSRRLGINMTPMIDVVFLLIIFFLVSSHLVRQETQMELALPVAASGDEEQPEQTPRVTVNVDENGTLWVAGQRVPSDQLATQLSAALENQGEDLEVRIRGSRDASYGSVEPIMLACTKVGIWNVKYAVYREDSQ